MTTRIPLSIRLRRRALDRRDAFFALVARALPLSVDPAFGASLFAFKNDELGFARALLGRCPNLWLYRSNQRAYCGDFVAIDMSSPSPSRRRAVLIELKRGRPVRVGGGGAGVQLRNADRLVKELALS